MSTKSQIRPTAKQLAYQDWEFGLFLHFGLRTYYEGYVDFDQREMTSSMFNPVNLDCDQWIRTAKEAGMRYAVLTAKHHDGFSNWPSRYTKFSVAHTPWRGGKGDVVRDFVESCRKYDVKPGLYYSPYDGSIDFYHQDERAYDDYFINQITELLSNYGQIHILWLDECGSGEHQYDWARIVGRIRRLQPDILIFNIADPDIRWSGNEDGIAPSPCWNVADFTRVSISGDKAEMSREARWLPVECDVQMRDNWFYSDHDEHTVKSIEELMGIYDYSVGRGANLLLNIGPNRQGLLPKKDVKTLLEFGAELRRRFQQPITSFTGCEVEAGKWIYQASEPSMVDHIVIEEDLAAGERVQGFKITIMTAKSHSPTTVYEGRNIGHKAIIRIPAVRTREIMLELTGANGRAVIRSLSFYHVG